MRKWWRLSSVQRPPRAHACLRFRIRHCLAQTQIRIVWEESPQAWHSVGLLHEPNEHPIQLRQQARKQPVQIAG
jgi:hypothetical protein